jgi:hypothetical protein
MKLAYIIMAHKQPEQLKRLILKLQTDHTSFFIHISRQAGNTYEETQELLKDIPNIYFLPRKKTHWGHPSLVKVAISGIKALCESGVSYDYALLLSGQDYPIKPTSHIEQFFTDNAGKQFTRFSPLDETNPRAVGTPPWNGIHRIKSRYLLFHSRRLRLPGTRSMPYAYTPYLGYLWWSFSQDFVEYIHTFLASHKRYSRFFNQVLISDEFFFQTLLLNSPFKENAVDDDLRYTDWENPNPFPPAILTADYIDRLQEAPHLFARKFDVDRDDEILDLIDDRILSK